MSPLMFLSNLPRQPRFHEWFLPACLCITQPLPRQQPFLSPISIPLFSLIRDSTIPRDSDQFQHHQQDPILRRSSVHPAAALLSTGLADHLPHISLISWISKTRNFSHHQQHTAEDINRIRMGSVQSQDSTPFFPTVARFSTQNLPIRKSYELDDLSLPTLKSQEVPD